MDFVALEIFCAVAAEGSVTRAAQRLQRVQSNVTTRVRQLEDAVGCTLFLREGKRMALTPEGQTLLAYAQRLLALASMREWVDAGLREPWRDAAHEAAALASGTLLADLRS